jgi:hypothetical protein
VYNIDRKQRFITENYDNEGTQKGLKLTFDKVEILEEQYETDLSEFNRNQFIECFGLLDCTTTASLDKEWSKISKYTNWCAAEGYCPVNLAISSIYRKDLIKYINLSAHKNLFIKSREDFYNYLKEVYNPQEQVIPVLLYEGIYGRPKQEHSFEEIKNLKATDCDYKKHTIIARRNDGTVRVLDDIDSRSMDIIFAAINQTEYYKGNGESNAKVKTVPLQETQNVIKIGEKEDNVEGISTITLDARIRNFKKWTGLYWLNAKNIFFSGMMERLQIKELEGELVKRDYEDVCMRFGWNPSRWYILKEKYMQFKDTLQD